MSTQINVVTGFPGLVAQNSKDTQANRRVKLEGETDQQVTKKSISQRKATLAAKGLAPDGKALSSPARRPIFYRPKPTANLASNAGSWLIVPDSNPESASVGFIPKTKGFPRLPFAPVGNYFNSPNKGFVYDNGTLISDLFDDGTGLRSESGNSYDTSTKPQKYKNYNSFTFEGFISSLDAYPVVTPVKWYYQGIWYWEFDVEVTYIEPTGATFTRTITNSRFDPYLFFGYPSRSGPASTRPIKPSAWQALYPEIFLQWFSIETNPATDVRIISERKVTSGEGIQTFYGYGSINSRTTFVVSLSPSSGPTQIFTFALRRQVTRPYVDEFGPHSGVDNLYYKFTQNSSYAEMNEVLISNVSYLHTKRHFAIARYEDYILFYFDGNLVSQQPSTSISDYLNSTVTVSISVFHSSDSDLTNFYSPTLIPGSGDQPGDYLIQNGSVTSASATRFRVSGLRFTGKRSLYTTSYFTPPTSIDELI